jgi:hypothetical protein
MGMSGFHLANNMRVLSTAVSIHTLRLSSGGLRQKLLPTVVAAKVERLSIACGAESGCFVHSHSANGSLVTDFVSFMVVLLSWLLLLCFDCEKFVT